DPGSGETRATACRVVVAIIHSVFSRNHSTRIHNHNRCRSVPSPSNWAEQPSLGTWQNAPLFCPVPEAWCLPRVSWGRMREWEHAAPDMTQGGPEIHCPPNALQKLRASV
ncbi:Hypothetical predicted protein, partial [Marmota monax]